VTVKILTGDCRDVLKTLPDQSAQCVVTSPPYFGLRDYGTGTWSGGDPDHEHDRVGARGGRGGSGAPGKQTTGAFPSTVPIEKCSCGAVRVDRQIGLEETPAAYVAEMVAVFREIWRVLRDDGTVWLNLGDSYASSGGHSAQGVSSARVGRANVDEQNSVRGFRPDIQCSGLKSKDLIGIPWAVAKALQEPYYIGKIKDIGDRIWLAAMIDAEGCMFIHKRKAGGDTGAKYERVDGSQASYARTQDQFGSGLEVANTCRAIVDRCQQITGLGSICEQTPSQNNRRKQTIYRWNLRNNECRKVIREIYPHFVAKQRQARLLIGCPPSGDKASEAHIAMMALHNGEPTEIDFPEPEGMFEPGWYLRRDIIWAKKNCMPESCTDRPTTAHEYVFLLTKRARYFYDAEAIKEPGTIPAGTKGAKGSAERFAIEGVNSRPPEYKIYDGTRNARSVWTIATKPFPEAHFATFAPELPERCILAGTSERGCCPACRAPWERVLDKVDTGRTQKMADGWDTGEGGHGTIHRAGREAGKTGVPVTVMVTIGWQPTCDCPPADPVPCVVLDPFSGAGTTALVADRLGRDAVNIELNPEYVAMQRTRIESDAGLFAQVAAE
jgi:DNA modification methylase